MTRSNYGHVAFDLICVICVGCFSDIRIASQFYCITNCSVVLINNVKNSNREDNSTCNATDARLQLLGVHQHSDD